MWFLRVLNTALLVSMEKSEDSRWELVLALHSVGSGESISPWQGSRKCLCLVSCLAGLIHRILILPLATINVPVHKDMQLKTNALDPFFPSEAL